MYLVASVRLSVRLSVRVSVCLSEFPTRSIIRRAAVDIRGSALPSVIVRLAFN